MLNERAPMNRPLMLAKTRGGLVAAVGLLAAWQFSSSAAADVMNPGYSKNEYFRLDWYYDLPRGSGHFTISSEAYPQMIVWQLEFMTLGVRFDTIHVAGEPAPFRVTPVGDDFEYSLLPSMYFDRELRFDVTFPSTGVGLAESSLTSTMSAVVGPFVPRSSVDFVTIQTIPEPAAVSMLAVGAAALLTRRRDD